MKKNKKFKEVTPVIETKEPAYESGSVGEFIELLKEFPADSKFTLNGNVNISDSGIMYDGEPAGVVIYPSEESLNHDYPEAEHVKDGSIFDKLEVCDADDECDCVIDNPVMDGHLYGMIDTNPNFVDAIRRVPTDDIIDTPLMMPNRQELQFEGKELLPTQLLCIDEIRQHNMYVAECMAELYRRQIAGLLEYNTQCLAHFGIEANKVMCEIVECGIMPNGNDIKITKF